MAAPITIKTRSDYTEGLLPINQLPWWWLLPEGWKKGHLIGTYHFRSCTDIETAGTSLHLVSTLDMGGHWQVQVIAPSTTRMNTRGN
jgi:hypothetical protein